MMKKLSKIILCVFSFFILVNDIDAISLKDYRIQYEKNLAKYNNSKNKQAEAKSKINSLQDDIGDVNNNIDKYIILKNIYQSLFCWSYYILFNIINYRRTFTANLNII